MRKSESSPEQVTSQADAEQDIRPVVALPPAGVPGAVIAGIAAAGALVLFVGLDAQRRNAAVEAPLKARNQVGVFAPPPPLIIPVEPTSRPDPEVVGAPRTEIYQPEPFIASPRQPEPAPYPSPPMIQFQPMSTPNPPMPNAIREPDRELDEPALVIDGGVEQRSNGRSLRAASQGQGTARPPGTAVTGDEAPVRATVISNRTAVMLIGTLIPAVLETPIDTTRPGLVRAVVSQDTRGFDGRRVLVPRGSRLIGEYQSDVRSGQNRVLVTWTRLVRPDGVAIRLASPAADPLGGAGIPGRLNTFFFRRFASAVLQSALTVGVNIASRPGRGSVIVGLPTGQVNNVVGDGLLGGDLKPRITVKQGAVLNVFVARDLDFSGLVGRQ